MAVEGAAWVWPETLDGVQPGDEALVYADLPASRPLRLTLAGRPLPADGALASAERPLLERAWAQARIERLLHLRETAHAGDDDLRRAIGLEVTELSVKHRVLSPFTALLVLETEADYARFGLDRRALADVLTVGPGGLDVLARTRPNLPRASDAVAQAQKPAPLARRELREDLGDLGDLGGSADSEEADGTEVPDGLAGGVEGGVVGGVSGGIVGGVPGGIVGGVPGGTVAPPPPPAAASPLPVPVEPAEVESEIAVTGESPAPSVADDAPLRVGSEGEPGAVEDVIIDDGSGRRRSRRDADERDEEERYADPYTGRFADVMKHLAAGRVARARAVAEAWSAEAPGDVLALVALGEAWERAGETAAAARAYGSLIDLFPSRADLRRLAGERLERLGEAGLELAIDTYRKAVVERPDHPSGHRLLAWALLRAGRIEAAFEALEQGLAQEYPGGRFAGVDRVLKEDLGLLAAAWLRAEPARREEVLERLAAHGAEVESEPSLRFVLTWETDANDVDLHVYDRRGGHAFYGEPELASGGALYADVTTGYGPECFTRRAAPARAAAPYRLRVHYYSRGPMGYGMGTVQVVGHDGLGRLSVEPRPFVVMADRSMVDLGEVEEGKPRRGTGR